MEIKSSRKVEYYFQRSTFTCRISGSSHRHFLLSFLFINFISTESLTPRSWLLFRTIFFFIINYINGFHWIYYEINIKCHLGHLLFNDSFRVVISFHWHFNLFKKLSIYTCIYYSPSIDHYLSLCADREQERKIKQKKGGYLLIPLWCYSCWLKYCQ